MITQWIKKFVKSHISASHIPLKIFQDIKSELYFFTIRLNNKLNPLSKLKQKKLYNQNNIKLHFGCGKRIIKDWVNIDGIYTKDIDHVMDLRTKLPFKNSSVNLIFTEHVIEHLDFYKDIPALFKEFYRILTKNGILRILVPDLEKYALNYINKDPNWFIKTTPDIKFNNNSEYINNIFYGHNHKFMYDYETLKESLKRSGFTTIYKTAYKKSGQLELALDLNNVNRENTSLCVEAIK